MIQLRKNSGIRNALVELPGRVVFFNDTICSEVVFDSRIKFLRSNVSMDVWMKPYLRYRNLFLTLAFLEVDDESGDVIVVNAGHNPPLLYKKSEDKLIPLTRTGMLMGVDNEASYGQSKLNLDAGDFIVSFTDGIPEAINEKEEEFGDDRFEQAILANKNESSEDLKNNLLASLNDFIGDTPQFDDITLLITKRK